MSTSYVIWAFGAVALWRQEHLIKGLVAYIFNWIACGYMGAGFSWIHND